jgi:hypothetical protein
MEKIIDAVDKMGFGWKLEYKYKCKHCNFETEDIVPIQRNFFG